MKIIPNLSFNGNCLEALEYYKKIFDGEILQIVTYDEVNYKCSEDEKKKIFSAIMLLGKNTVYFNDKLNEKIGNNITMIIEFFNEEDLNNISGKLSKEGTISVEMGETTWGSQYVEIVDKFGIVWGLNYEMQLI
ncbi:MAG: VOC family protein [Fusobacteriaceae bacterium]|nr:VOC family protein [Fusobacteriaceae bacterium]MBU9918016.1 VOC family protein [Fusobacteriaceae bacterium]